MKYLIATILVLFAVNAHATTYCQWVGSEGVNCKLTRGEQNILYLDGYFPFKENATKANGYGYYELLTVNPVVDSATEKRGDIQWSFADNQITRTWLVADKTTDELNNDKCALIRSNIWIVKKLIANGTLDVETDITANEKAAYQACVALGE